ncbi:anhydro-N-acetylmuramic acid kinase [Chroococcidiopsis sp. FACHB-1243]|uniref:anhydro-N-acetylmuramic acid kinase n=1 Tax=Chroococcidiopsis sp. [FACHB-1243] TaxID=2692781 RepID=UPI00177C96F8|nr:anhydro-N-acetylmuramic acid kinase [Chroococcidiopsis sp. [FACHB-1243]]MBD2304404.1 anhydro-N-acetylmuramic acid kinase [Chroococcidiopsis sp. [FACHB-1243]]
MTLVVGLISGTSVDGIDAALINITGRTEDIQVELLAANTYPYPTDLRSQILAACKGEAISISQLAALDDAIALCFAQAAQNIQAGHPPAELIGSHGQTVFHRPPLKKAEGATLDSPVRAGLADSLTIQAGDFWSKPAPTTPDSRTDVARNVCTTQNLLGYSLQLGRGAVIAQLTNTPTVSNFRAADIAVGGHGAPLVPKVDAYLLSHMHEARCVQNLGGIGNLAYLPPRSHVNWEEKVRGWDTGPANTLLDLAVQHLTEGAQTYDRDGNWAASGTPCHPLVEQWLSQDFFHLPPPKSTGRELFGWEYLQQCLVDARSYQLSASDLLATLTEFTVASIVHSYRTFLPQMPARVLLCGGGSRNLYLKQRLQFHLEVPVITTDEAGLSADFKEAIAFAVLAYWRQQGIPGNLPQVTGAKQAVLLGEVVG